jgi:hypothetical protein
MVFGFKKENKHYGFGFERHTSIGILFRFGQRY